MEGVYIQIYRNASEKKNLVLTLDHRLLPDHLGITMFKLV
jgi:hypothetical protein